MVNENSIKHKKKKDGGEIIIISVGGSLVVPENIDTSFLLSLKRCILGYVAQGKKFVLVIGGGDVCRKYQKAASKVSHISSTELDWLGIYSTYLNAQLIRTIFGKKTATKILTDLSETVIFPKGKKIMIAGGWKPGCSTDYDTVMLARMLGSKKVINLSNIDFVCDKDPRENPDAKSIKDISWKDFRKMFNGKWNPGLNSPFDPVASKLAEKEGIEVAIINGKKLAQFEHYLNNRSFKGTLIS